MQKLIFNLNNSNEDKTNGHNENYSEFILNDISSDILITMHGGMYTQELIYEKQYKKILEQISRNEELYEIEFHLAKTESSKQADEQSKEMHEIQNEHREKEMFQYENMQELADIDSANFYKKLTKCIEMNEIAEENLAMCSTELEITKKNYEKVSKGNLRIKLKRAITFGVDSGNNVRVIEKIFEIIPEWIQDYVSDNVLIEFAVIAVKLYNRGRDGYTDILTDSKPWTSVLNLIPKEILHRLPKLRTRIIARTLLFIYLEGVINAYEQFCEVKPSNDMINDLHGESVVPNELINEEKKANLFKRDKIRREIESFKENLNVYMDGWREPFNVKRIP